MGFFTSPKRAVSALIVAPLLAAPTMTVIEILLLVVSGESYATSDLGAGGVFLINLWLYFIVFTPVSYIALFALFLPVMCFAHVKGSVTFFRTLTIGVVVGLILPSLIKATIYLQFGLDYSVPVTYIFPDLSNSESVELYIASTFSGGVVSLGFWVVGGLAKQQNK